MNSKQRRNLARKPLQAAYRRDASPSIRSLMAGPSKNRKGAKLTPTQRDSTGKRSDWSRASSGPSLFIDPKWSFTVGNRP